MTTPSLSCSLTFSDSWRATREEMTRLIKILFDSLSQDGVQCLTIGGDISEGSLNIDFDIPGATEDSLVGMSLVVKALNKGRVSAPGWPDDHVIDTAIASVEVRELSLS